MSLFRVAFSYLRDRLFNSFLYVLMMAVGVMMITVLLLVGHFVSQRLTADSKGIDTVIGAKGSPLQLVLSSVWHVDVPTGNISFSDAEKVMKNPQVSEAIPISLGDSYEGFRIVGSEISYFEHFGAKFLSGGVWNDSMEAVIGYDVALKSDLSLGDVFFGSHGLVQFGKSHNDEVYKVVGVLKKTGTVLDRLIVTSLESVWDIHDHEEEGGHNDDMEITALLVKYKSRISGMVLPRVINKETNMQAASPSLEIARLIKIVGFGRDGVFLFGGFLVVMSVVAMLIGLLNSVYQRRYDLAVFRSLGASRKKILSLIVIEGMTVALIGVFIGLLFGHFVVEIFGIFSVKGAELGFSGFVFLPEIFILLTMVLLFFLIVCLIPGIRAYKTDIKETLAS